MVDRIRWDTVSYLPFYYVFFQFLLLTIFNLQANILTTKDILSNLDAAQDALSQRMQFDNSEQVQYEGIAFILHGKTKATGWKQRFPCATKSELEDLVRWYTNIRLRWKETRLLSLEFMFLGDSAARDSCSPCWGVQDECGQDRFSLWMK